MTHPLALPPPGCFSLLPLLALLLSLSLSASPCFGAAPSSASAPSLMSSALSVLSSSSFSSSHASSAQVPVSHCWMGSLPTYDMQPSSYQPWQDERFDERTSEGVWYYRPCGVVTHPLCVRAFGYTAQLCYVADPTVGPAYRMTSFELGSTNYSDPSSYQWQLTTRGIDMRTQTGGVCAKDPSRPYNVTIHFQCYPKQPFDSVRQHIDDLSLAANDPCQVEGTISSNAFCTLWPEQWQSHGVCQFGPYNYTAWYQAGDLSYTMPITSTHNSTTLILFHPCGYVLDPRCTAVDPTSSLCQLTLMPDGSWEVTILAHWTGQYQWMRYNQPQPASTSSDYALPYNRQSSLQWMGGTVFCPRAPRTVHDDLFVVYRCDPLALSPQLEYGADLSDEVFYQIPFCVHYVLIRTAMMCMQASSSSTATEPLDPSPLPAHFFHTSPLIITAVAVSLLVCLFYLAVPCLSRRRTIKLAATPPSAVAEHEGQQYVGLQEEVEPPPSPAFMPPAFMHPSVGVRGRGRGGGGGADVVRHHRPEGVMDFGRDVGVYDTDQLVAGGEWFIAASDS